MKYLGSKNRIAKDILPIILKHRKENQWYVETCVGGANMIDKVKGHRAGFDNNEFLIEMLIALQGGWIPESYSKEQYSDIRSHKDNYPKHVVGWVGINCSYSGKWFGGFAGITETKNGVRDYQKEAIKNVLNQVDNLKNVLFKHVDYKDLILKELCIIYCDPPYEGTTGYNNIFNHVDFWNWCRKMASIGHYIYVSEYKAPEDFSEVWCKKINSSLSANGKIGGSKNSVEKLFIHESQRFLLND